MLPILTTSALLLLGLLPQQNSKNPGALAQGNSARRSLPQNPVPSSVVPSSVVPGSVVPGNTKTRSKASTDKESSVEFVAPGYYGIYSSEKSREIYAACDLDGDDKIQYFEARNTLDSVSNPKDFRRLDKNNDGVLRYSELDTHFRRICEAGSNMVVKPKAMSRIHLRSEDKKTKDHGIRRWFTLIDKDSNDKIDTKEWSDISPLLGEGLGSDFLKLDADFSGNLTIDELKPLKPLFDRFEATKSSSSHLRPLPESTRSVDLNDDGLLAMTEFSRALARIHPSLVQHAKIIFMNADRNDDGFLDAIEITKALTLGTKARQERKLRLR